MFAYSRRWPCEHNLNYRGSSAACCSDYHRVFKCDTLWIILLEPSIGGFGRCKHPEVPGITNFARDINIDPDRHDIASMRSRSARQN
jgi:hypothetical protein